MAEEDSFQITLPSISCLSIFPENKPNAYKTLLQKNICLQPEQWEFALVDIQYPQNWFNLFESSSLGIVIRPASENARTMVFEAGKAGKFKCEYQRKFGTPNPTDSSSSSS